MSKILLVGCGKMGGALAHAWREKTPHAIRIIDPAPALEDLDDLWRGNLAALEEDFVPDVVGIAVKPQVMAEILPPYGRFATALFLSIAAGVGMEKIEALLGGPRAVLRAMPNLPASLGAGAAGFVVNERVSAAQKELGFSLLRAAGLCVEVEKESLIDAVTALSGSGPAYVFALVEAMAEAGVRLGLTRDAAEALARQTMIGSGALLAQSPLSAQELRRAVTSPGGTTQAALVSLQGEGGLPDLLSRAMQAAFDRAQELAQ